MSSRPEPNVLMKGLGMLFGNESKKSKAEKLGAVATPKPTTPERTTPRAEPTTRAPVDQNHPDSVLKRVERMERGQ